MTQTIQSEILAAKMASMVEKAANINREVKELNLDLLELRDIAPVHIGVDPSSGDDQTIIKEIKR